MTADQTKPHSLSQRIKKSVFATFLLSSEKGQKAETGIGMGKAGKRLADASAPVETLFRPLRMKLMEYRVPLKGIGQVG